MSRSRKGSKRSADTAEASGGKDADVMEVESGGGEESGGTIGAAGSGGAGAGPTAGDGAQEEARPAKSTRTGSRKKSAGSKEDEEKTAAAASASATTDTTPATSRIKAECDACGTPIPREVPMPTWIREIEQNAKTDRISFEGSQSLSATSKGRRARRAHAVCSSALCCVRIALHACTCTGHFAMLCSFFLD
jgi:hypothetical protein